MIGDTRYIKMEVEAALIIDEGLFTIRQFLEFIGEVINFDRILIKIIAEICTEKIAIIAQNTQNTIDGSCSEAIHTLPLAFIQLSQIFLIFFRTLKVLWSELSLPACLAVVFWLLGSLTVVSLWF